MGDPLDQNDGRFRPKAQSFCNDCFRVTSHRVLYAYLRESAELEPENEQAREALRPYVIAEMQACAGCGDISLVLRSSDESQRTDDTYEDGHSIYNEDEETYPRPRERRAPRWVWGFEAKIPERQQQLLYEVYSAYAVNAMSLVAMGIRSIIDAFADEHVGDVGNFVQKLDELEKQRFITPLGRSHLEVVVDAGNAAAHRGAKFSKERINHMLDTIEHVLANQYVFSNRSRELRRDTPKRRKRRLKKAATP